MKNSILKSLMVAFVATLFCFNTNAQVLKDLPLGPNGGNMFPTNVKGQKVECKLNGNKASFYIINDKDKNAKLDAAAASATIIIDYAGEKVADSKQVTITSKNKFDVTLPEDVAKVNFLAFRANFNGDIMEARFILRDLAAPAPQVDPVK